MTEKTCIMCGKPLPPRRRVYCSDECRDKRWHLHWTEAKATASKVVGYRPMMWPALANEQIIRHPVCARCGNTHDLEAHHIRPLASGGSNMPDNLITLCHNCHRAQHKGMPRKNDSSRTVQGALVS